MNVVVGKLGKKFYMRKKSWLIDSGDSEVATSLIVLAKKHPEMNFYIIGTSDFDTFTPEERKDYFPNENVTYIWEYYDKNDGKPRWDFPLNFFKERNITIDFGWIHAGPTGAVNVPEKTYKVRDIFAKQIAKTIIMSVIYAGPMVHYLNESQIPYIVVGEDPRYYPCRARDLFNRPKLYLNTYNDKVPAKYVSGYLSTDILVEKEILQDAKYDRWFLASEQHPERVFGERDILLDIYTNGRESSGKRKMRIMKEYLADPIFKDTVIYGKWSEKLIEEAPNFKFQNTAMIDLIDEMYRTKYTLMFHFKEGYPSSKFWKMIYFGIIPFFHWNMDTQKNQPVHEYCRVKTAEEMILKIKELEANPALYKEIQDYHYNLFTDKYMNGELIDEIFVYLFNKFTNEKVKMSEVADYKRVSVLNNDLAKIKEESEGVNVLDIFANL